MPDNSNSSSVILEGRERVKVARDQLLEALALFGGRATTDDLRAFPRDPAKRQRDIKIVAYRISLTSAYD